MFYERNIVCNWIEKHVFALALASSQTISDTCLSVLSAFAGPWRIIRHAARRARPAARTFVSTLPYIIYIYIYICIYIYIYIYAHTHTHTYNYMSESKKKSATPWQALLVSCCSVETKIRCILAIALLPLLSLLFTLLLLQLLLQLWCCFIIVMCIIIIVSLRPLSSFIGDLQESTWDDAREIQGLLPLSGGNSPLKSKTRLGSSPRLTQRSFRPKWRKARFYMQMFTRNCDEASESAQARTDSTRARKHCPSRRKARLSRRGGRETTKIQKEEEERTNEERSRRIRVPTGTPHTHSQTLKGDALSGNPALRYVVGTG